MDNIEYYEHQVKFQENLAKIQQKRAVLEQEFSSLTETDKRLRTLRTTRLRSYRKQICERERKAQERNEALLKDFNDFDERLSKISAHTAKLEKIKEKCEKEMTKLYPQWRYEIDVDKTKRQLEDSGLKFDPVASSLPADFNLPRNILVSQVDAPLFKLVPYNFEKDIQSSRPNSLFLQPVATSSSVSPVNNNSRDRSASPKPRVKVKKQSVEKSNSHSLSKTSTKSAASKDLQSLLKTDESAVSQQDNIAVSRSSMSPTHDIIKPSKVPIVPPLELHKMGKMDQTNSEKQLESSSTNIVIPSNSIISRDFVPSPSSPSLHYSLDVDVHRVEITDRKREPSLHSNKDFLSDLSDVSSVSLISNKAPVVDLESGHFDGEINHSETKSPSPKHDDVFTMDGVPKSEVVAIKTSQPIKIPRPSVESVPSESLATTEPSQKGVPLISNPAYQNMLRNSTLSNTFENQHDEDGDDELEKLVSPKTKGLPLLSDDNDEESHRGSISKASSHKSRLLSDDNDEESHRGSISKASSHKSRLLSDDNDEESPRGSISKASSHKSRLLSDDNDEESHRGSISKASSHKSRLLSDDNDEESPRGSISKASSHKSRLLSDDNDEESHRGSISKASSHKSRLLSDDNDEESPRGSISKASSHKSRLLSDDNDEESHRGSISKASSLKSRLLSDDNDEESHRGSISKASSHKSRLLSDDNDEESPRGSISKASSHKSRLLSDDNDEESPRGSINKASSRKSSLVFTPRKVSFVSNNYMGQKQKAPWDTDSEEDDSYKIQKAVQPLSADDDDFDLVGHSTIPVNARQREIPTSVGKGLP